VSGGEYPQRSRNPCGGSAGGSFHNLLVHQERAAKQSTTVKGRLRLPLRPPAGASPFVGVTGEHEPLRSQVRRLLRKTIVVQPAVINWLVLGNPWRRGAMDSIGPGTAIHHAPLPTVAFARTLAPSGLGVALLRSEPRGDSPDTADPSWADDGVIASHRHLHSFPWKPGQIADDPTHSSAVR
jgi:hypothetical protein